MKVLDRITDGGWSQPDVEREKDDAALTEQLTEICESEAAQSFCEQASPAAKRRAPVEEEVEMVDMESRDEYWDAESMGMPASVVSGVEGAAPKAVFPTWNFVALSLTMLTNSMWITSLLPFVKFMVVDLDISEVDSGLWVGIIASAFMVGRAITSVMWGRFADRRGRKPTLVLSLVSIVLFAVPFGMPVNVYLQAAIRFVAGMTNSSGGIGKVVAAELSPPEFQAKGMSICSVTWALGNILGPALGGVFVSLGGAGGSSEGVYPFTVYPYLAPMAIIGFLAVVSIFAVVFSLPETLKKQPQPVADSQAYASLDGPDDEEAGSETGVTAPPPPPPPPAKLSLFQTLRQNRALTHSIVLYSLWSFQSIAFVELYNLWGSTAVSLGGLGLTSAQLGLSQAFAGASVIVFQLAFLQPLSKRFGNKRLAALCLALYTPAECCILFVRNFVSSAPSDVVGSSTLTIPYDSLILESHNATVGFEESGNDATLALVLSTIVLCTIMPLGSFTFTLQFIFINNSVKQRSRGEANGIAMAVASLFKALGPFVVGAVFAWSISAERILVLSWPLAWILINAASISCLILTIMLPDRVSTPPVEET
eukprot:Rhum_TRINITY_DN14791_c0_g1::Rhum_TRINITY_DN14791_c0_g1_i4::g.116044::m.116044